MNSGMRYVLPSISTGRSGKRLAKDCGSSGGFPVVQCASDDYRLIAVEIVLNEVLLGRAVKPGNRRLKGSYCS
jgi:hypothetical protein